MPIVVARPEPRQRSWAAALVVVALAVLPLGVTILAGGFGLARNDDWSYSDLLWRWADTGDLRLGGWESMTLLGQLLLAWPLASIWPRNVASLQLFTVVVGAGGALAALAALRQFLSIGRATLAVALTLISPLYAPLAVSFMTDVPAFAVQSVCVWCGARSLTAAATRNRWFIAAMAVGAYGVTIREYAVVAPAAVLVVFVARAWGRRDTRALATGVVTGVVTALLLVGFVAWRRSWRASLSLEPSIPDGLGDALSSLGRSGAFTLVTITFLVLPAFAFVPLRRLVEAMTATRWGLVAVVSATIVLAIGAITTWEWSPPLLGPYLDQRGALGNDILPGDRALLLPSPLFFGLLVVTLLASIAFVGVLVLTAAAHVGTASTWRARFAAFDPRTLAWVFVVGTVLSLTAAGIADLPVFDRYLLPAVPFAAALVLAWRPEVKLLERTAPNAARWAVVAIFFVLGAIWTVDSSRFDATRWAAGERAVQLGYPADRVDAGFEWRNVHRPTSEAPTSPSQPDPDACVRLTAAGADLGPAWTPLFTIDHWHGAAGSDPLTAWATGAPGCPPLP